MTTVSVIITACNCGGVIGRTLQSVADAIAFYRATPAASREPEPQVIVVDDGSSDQTGRVVRDFASGRLSWRVVRRASPSSPSCARNTGVREAQGDLLFFLDGDDLYLPNHLSTCVRALQDGAVDYVKTAVRLPDPVHPDWRPRIEHSLVINLALRRHCHERIGGFPDYHLFRRTGDRFEHEADLFYKLEDQFYNALVTHFYRGVGVREETVAYCRYPGNSFDRQYQKLCRPFGSRPTAEPEDVPRLRVTQAIIQNRIEQLAPSAAGREPDKSILCLGDGAVALPRSEPALADAGAEAAFGRACTLVEQGKPEEAVKLFREVVRARPDHAEARLRLGIGLAERGQRAEAITHFRAALQVRPEAAPVHYNLGVALAEEGKKAEALQSFHEAARLQPDYAVAHYAAANVLGTQGRHEEAVASYRRAVKSRPDYGEAYNNLGLALLEVGRRGQATAVLRHALRLRPQAPESHNNLGLALAAEGRFAEAEACYQEALRLNRRYADALDNLASALKEQGRHEEALATYDLALGLQPESASTHWNRSLALLQTGDFERGWSEYEWRWKRARAVPRGLPGPAWDGSSLGGRTFLLYMEQGLGDMIQFIRYAPLVQQQGGRVIVECARSLRPLFESCAGIDQLVEEGSDLPPFDVHAPLLSLPYLLRTTLGTIPANVPYLAVDPARSEAWGRVVSRIDGFKVGIVWQGNPRHAHDHHRSVSLRQFAPLARLPGVRLISLQKGAGVEELRGLEGRLPIIELEDERDPDGGWQDTAALVTQLDLVVTVDTGIAHLAGALGKPVWVALSAVSDWRWLLGRDDSPWYPTLRLFRQRTLGCWQTVFRRMARELRRRIESSSPRSLQQRIPAAA